MSDSQTKLYNQALGLVGSTRRVASPTEASVEAETCDLYYDSVRQTILSAAHWPSARSAFRLNQLAENDGDDNWELGDPQPGFTYAHALPGDFLHARYINEGDHFELSTYTASDESTQNCIVSNSEYVVLTYTRDQTTVTAWSKNLYQAIYYGLAGMICWPLTRKLNKSQLLIQRANDMILQARAVKENQEYNQMERLAPWLQARGSYYNVTNQYEYMHPYGPLLAFQTEINEEYTR